MNLMMNEIINRYMNQILVHSYLYEVCNVSIISDYEWDLRAKKLVKLIQEHRDIASKLPYYDQFKGWHGDTASTFKFDKTIECRAKLCYFCAKGELLDEH